MRACVRGGSRRASGKSLGLPSTRVEVPPRVEEDHRHSEASRTAPSTRLSAKDAGKAKFRQKATGFGGTKGTQRRTEARTVDNEDDDDVPDL